MAIESGGLEAPGLVAKQAIRAGANREVLTALCATTHIFNAWADEQWINDGAAERVSLVCFGTGGLAIQLNGQPVPHISADLTGVLGLDMTQAKALPENAGGSFEGTKKYGDFDVPGLLARQWLALPNPPWQVQCSGGQTFPFPLGLTPLVTAHQQTETLPNGAIIPLLTDFHIENVPQALTDKAQVATKTKAKTAACTSAAEVGVARMSGAPSNGEAYEPPASEPPLPGEPPTMQASESPSSTSTQNQPAALVNQAPEAIKKAALSTTRRHAECIATAAKRLSDLREAWLNPPEWTHRVPEVVPLGMTTSPYPDRIEPRPGIREADFKALQKRTLTNLYNLRPAWLTMAHQQLDLAVANAYGWADYSPAMPDDEVLKRLLAMNLAHSVTISGQLEPQKP